MIRKIKNTDKEAYIKMAEEFYNTDAVIKPIPLKHFEKAFDELMTSDRYIQAYIFEYNGQTAGYCLTVTFFSQEAGGKLLWIDEIFVLEKYRKKGIGREFFEYIQKNMPNEYVGMRLETEKSNTDAVSLYESIGFEPLEYSQMIKIIK